MKRNCCFFALVVLSTIFPPTRVWAGDCQAVTYYAKTPPFPSGFPGSRDLSFHATNASIIWTVVTLPNGKILIADENGLARLNADGSRDAGFVASFAYKNQGSLISAIALQPDGKILAAGYFDSVNDSRQLFIARLNPNGSPDESFVSPFTESDLTNVFCCRWSLALQADGKVLVAGGFVRVGQINRSGIARLNADGSLDLTFSPDPIFPSEGGSINALVTQPDQKVLIGTFHGTYRLKADGSLDTSFGGVAGYTSFLASQPDGKLLAGWWWGLKRFNADGSLDPGFDALGLWGGLSSLSCGISVIALQTNGKILVGGQEGGLVRLNPDGGLDASFDLAAGLCSTLEVGGVTSLGIQTDGQLIVAGRFLDTCLDDFAYLVRLNDGELPMILPRSIRRSPTGEFEFRATGPTNQTWIIQVAHTLAAPNWTAVATNTLGIESLTFTDPGAANIPSRFYRATLSQ